MRTTIEKITPLNELIDTFTSKEELRKTITNLDDIFFYFTVNTTDDECEDKDFISVVYKNIKDFLLDLDTPKEKFVSLEKTIENMLRLYSLKETINGLNDLFYFFILNNDEFIDKVNIISSYKHIKDFLLSLEPYEKERNQRLDIEFNRN